MTTDSKLQEKTLKAFYSISDKMRKLALTYNDEQMFHLHQSVKSELKKLTLERKKLLNLLKSYGIKPFDFHSEKKHFVRSDFGQSWVNWLSYGDIQQDIYTNPHDLKFNWRFFGTLTAGFETITAKGIIRLTEKYFYSICERIGIERHNIKFFYVVEKFKTKFNEKDRYHVHYLLDCPDSLVSFDFVNYLGDVKNNSKPNFVLHDTWQRLLKSPPQIFGEDDWSRIENKSVPKTARWHRTNFSVIKRNSEDYEKAISYVVKYICKGGKGVPHYNLLTSSDYLKSRYKDLVVDYNKKKEHLESFGCKYDKDHSIKPTNQVFSSYFLTDKFINKSKSQGKYQFMHNNVRSEVALLLNPPSFDGYIENFFKFSTDGGHIGTRKSPFPDNVDLSDFVDNQMSLDF